MTYTFDARRGMMDAIAWRLLRRLRLKGCAPAYSAQALVTESLTAIKPDIAKTETLKI
jgi:hypothetical protein